MREGDDAFSRLSSATATGVRTPELLASDGPDALPAVSRPSSMNVDNAAHLSLSSISSTPVLHGVFLAWSSSKEGSVQCVK